MFILLLLLLIMMIIEKKNNFVYFTKLIALMTIAIYIYIFHN